MRILNLTAIHPVDANDHILKACEHFIEEVVCNCARNISEHMKVAQGMAEQILAHYDSLSHASKELEGFCSQNQKQMLPEYLLKTLLHACVQEHPLLGVIIDELHDLYAGVWRTNDLRVISDFMGSDRRFKIFAKPQMIDKAGVLRYSPDAFRMVYPTAFQAEINARFRAGAPALEQLLSLYPEMSANSRTVLDAELCMRIYASTEPDDSPVRKVLRDKIDDMDDAKSRLRMLFECDMTNDPDDFFLQRVEFAFGLIDRLNPEQAQKALTELDSIITAMIKETPTIDVFGDPIECMTKVFVRAKAHGHNPLVVMSKNVGFVGAGVAYVTYVLNNLSPIMDLQTTYSMWAEAAVLSLDDDRLIELGLQEHHLGWVAGRTGSPVLREHLQKSGAGRDVVFAQDLGL